MSVYFNQMNIKIGEVARLYFNDVVDQDIDLASELICPIELLPAIALTLQQAYEEHAKRMKSDRAERETNKSLS